METYLMHYGVKGQKWGVRRFQNPDGSLTPEGRKHYGVKSIDDIDILKKDTELNSVAGISFMDFLRGGKQKTALEYQNSGRPMYTYLANNQWDNKVYKGPFAMYLSRMRGIRLLTEYRYKVVDDLAMPKKEDRVNEFKKLMNDKKYSKDALKLLENIQTQLAMHNIGGAEHAKKIGALDLKNLKTDDDWNLAYEIFNHAMEASYAYKTTREYVKRMSEKYDAMIDDNNKDIYNNAMSPIIIFNASKVIQQNGDTKLLEIDEIEKNYLDVKKELEKQGKRVLL